MKGKLRLGFWYLRHPAYYGELGRHALRKLRTDRSHLRAQKSEALRWCETNAIDTNTARNALTGQQEFPTWTDQFPQEIAQGRQALTGFSFAGEGCAGNTDLIYFLTEHLQATRVIETGVAAGWSSLAFLLSLQKRSGAQLVSTDLPYPIKNADKFTGCVVPDRLKALWQLIRLPDREGLPIALQNLPEIDVCHYDSDKSYEGRAWAYPRLWKALRPGGIFISDDIDDNLFFREFSATVMRHPWVVVAPATVGVKYVGVLIK